MKLAHCISRIEINSLWCGHKHIVWNVRPDVNVLSGGNGAGKSTILNRLIEGLRTVPATGELTATGRLGVKIDFDPADATGIRYDIIRSFDRRLVGGDKLGQLTDLRVSTELDWQLYLLQRRYLDYQVDVANRIIELLSSGDPAIRTTAAAAAEQKTRFQDLVDELFSETGKRIDRRSNELSFIQYDAPCRPTSCQAARSRCSSSSSPSSPRTASPTYSLWTSRRPVCTSSGRNASSAWCGSSIPTRKSFSPPTHRPSS